MFHSFAIEAAEILHTQRASGFIAGRLTGIFIYHKAKQGLKIKENPVNYFN
jgi:hypothetical protein